jgi:CRISPR-associated exonuclease Cas4
MTTPVATVTTAPANAPMLSVSELKQFVYCPRIFYYLTVPALHPPVTGLMKRGHDLQAQFERLEPRRVLSRYGFGRAIRQFSLPLTDAEMGVTGLVDLLLEAEDRLAVVEFKASAAALAENHRFQLAAYALLAERAFGKPCPRGFALYVDREEVEEIELGEELRGRVGQAFAEMRRVFQEGCLPMATAVRARCANCEFKNFCGDVF